MFKISILSSMLLIGAIGTAGAVADEMPLEELTVSSYSTGFFQNGIRTVAAEAASTYCALTTTTNLTNIVSLKYCTVTRKDGVFLLTAFADSNGGVNCSMSCFATR